MKHKLKEILPELGITQKELAKRVGMSEVGVSKLVNGTTTKATLEKIAEAIGVPFSSIAVEEKVLRARYGSDKTPLHIGNLELPCYILEDGTRVFSGRGIQKAIGSGSTSGEWLSRFVGTSPIEAILKGIKAGNSTVFDKFKNPIKFTRNNAGGSQSETYGYEATSLIDLCDAVIKAGEMGHEMPPAYMVNANIIIRAVAKTGIIALVDEATGYDKEKSRAKDELQKFLNAFLSSEASRWVKTFDDDFFEMIYRMRGWTWTGASQRPGVVGVWINDIVYERLAPAVLNELKARNPKNENGNRAHKHHQYLTEDIGHPKLKEHIAGVMAIGRISNNNWGLFMRNLDKAYPKKYQQLTLDFDDDMEYVH